MDGEQVEVLQSETAIFLVNQVMVKFGTTLERIPQEIPMMMVLGTQITTLSTPPQVYTIISLRMICLKISDTV